MNGGESMSIIWIADIILVLALAAFLALLLRLGRVSEPYDEWVERERRRHGRK